VSVLDRHEAHVHVRLIESPREFKGTTPGGGGCLTPSNRLPVLESETCSCVRRSNEARRIPEKASTGEPRSQENALSGGTYSRAIPGALSGSYQGPSGVGVFL